MVFFNYIFALEFQGGLPDLSQGSVSWPYSLKRRPFPFHRKQNIFPGPTIMRWLENVIKSTRSGYFATFCAFQTIWQLSKIHEFKPHFLGRLIFFLDFFNLWETVLKNIFFRCGNLGLYFYPIVLGILLVPISLDQSLSTMEDGSLPWPQWSVSGSRRLWYVLYLHFLSCRSWISLNDFFRFELI